jgi:hypothetical protein
MESIMNTNTLILRTSHLIDSKSMLFCLTRYMNEKHNLNIPLKQSYLNSLEIDNIDDYLDSVIFNKVNLDEKIKDEYTSFLKSNHLYNTIKPRLLYSYNIYYLIKLLLSNNIPISLIIIYDTLDKFILENQNMISDNNSVINKFIKLTGVDNYQNCNIEDIDSLFKKAEAELIKTEKKGIVFITASNKVISLDGQSNENNNISYNYEQFFKSVINEINIQDKEEITNNYLSNFILILASLSKEFIYKFNKIEEFALQSLWFNDLKLINKTVLTSKIVKGFQRGSKSLGVPTANLEITETIKNNLSELVNGVYYGHISFNTNSQNNPNISLQLPLKCVLSIGYNPYFDNLEKTVEVFIINFEGGDFYDDNVTLEIYSYLRSESAFENFSELVTAIAYDIGTADRLLDEYSNKN